MICSTLGNHRCTTSTFSPGIGAGSSMERRQEQTSPVPLLAWFNDIMKLTASVTWAHVLATAASCSWLLHWKSEWVYDVKRWNSMWTLLVYICSLTTVTSSGVRILYLLHITLLVAWRWSSCETHPEWYRCTFLCHLHGDQGPLPASVEVSLHVFRQTTLAVQTVLLDICII